MTIRPAFLLPLLLAACTAGVPTGTQPGARAGTDALAQVRRWKLQSATDEQGRPIAAVLPQGRAVHSLVFTDDQLAIEGGCNHIGARYRIDGTGRPNRGQSALSPASRAFRGRPIFAGPAVRASRFSMAARKRSVPGAC